MSVISCFFMVKLGQDQLKGNEFASTDEGLNWGLETRSAA
jgi:hypothetical protein